MRRCVLLSLLFLPLAFAQVPQITFGGVVSAASWSSPIAPGELISIFGTNFGSASGGTSVTINGISAPVTFVSPTQINAQVPAPLTTIAAPNLAAASVVVTTPAGSSNAEIAALAGSAPGFFTVDSSGCGQVAALNIRPDGTVSLNSPTNSAAPGDYLALFGTGFGFGAQQTVPSLSLDNTPLPSVAWAGPAPGLAGTDQVNLQLPATTRNGCNVPVSVNGFWGGPQVTVSVEGGRGQCIDPPVKSYGVISLSKFIAPAGFQALASTEFFSASFPSGPDMQPPAPEAIVFAPQWAASAALTGSIISILSPAPLYPRSCIIPGYANLSAGTIQIQPPSGGAVTVVPSSGLYGSVLPDGFIGPGSYTLTGTPGSAVSLNATLNIGSPIQIQSAFASGTSISASQPLTVKWTGGDPGTLVRVALTSQNSSIYSYADAGSGSLTITPQCRGTVCTYGLPLSTNAGISVTVLPAPNRVGTVTVPGVTGPVQITWQYNYQFSGLTLSN